MGRRSVGCRSRVTTQDKVVLRRQRLQLCRPWGVQLGAVTEEFHVCVVWLWLGLALVNGAYSGHKNNKHNQAKAVRLKMRLLKRATSAADGPDHL